MASVALSLLEKGSTCTVSLWILNLPRTHPSEWALSFNVVTLRSKNPHSSAVIGSFLRKPLCWLFLSHPSADNPYRYSLLLFTTPRHRPTPAPNSRPHLVRNGVWLVKPIPTQCRLSVAHLVPTNTPQAPRKEMCEISGMCPAPQSDDFAWCTRRHFWICSRKSSGTLSEVCGFREKIAKNEQLPVSLPFAHSALSAATCGWNSEGERCHVVGPHLLFSLGSSGPGFEGLFSPLLLWRLSISGAPACTPWNELGLRYHADLFL